MRIALAALVWITILGGLFVYSRTRHYVQPARAEAEKIEPLPGDFYVELTPTYDVPQGDAFAVEVSDPIVVTLNGDEIYRRELPVAAGEVIAVKWDTKKFPLIAGKNEFFVNAAPPDGNTTTSPAVRLRLLRAGEVQDEQTLWGRPNFPVKGPVSLNYSDYYAQEDKHEH